MSSQKVFDLYELVEIIFKHLPYYYVSVFRNVNITCNLVGKSIYEIKYKEEVVDKAYAVLHTIEDTSFVTLNWESLFERFRRCLFTIIDNLSTILIHDLSFLERFIFQCIDFQQYYGNSFVPYDMNLKYHPWWTAFKKGFKKFCWVDYPENFNCNELKQVAKLKGVQNYSRLHRNMLIRKLKRRADESFMINLVED